MELDSYFTFNYRPLSSTYWFWDNPQMDIGVNNYFGVPRDIALPLPPIDCKSSMGIAVLTQS